MGQQQPLVVVTMVTSRQVSTARRRRRRGAAGEAPTVSQQEEGKNQSDPASSSVVNKHVAVTDTLTFAIEAQEFLDKIEESLQPMKSCNDVFEIERDSQSLVLTLAPADGQYSFQIEETASSIFFQSPISGKFQYILSASTREWVSEEDGHLLEGMLVRDLIRHCNGLPKL